MTSGISFPDRPRLDLAIVTSCHNYGRYLRDWALSIVSLSTYLPSVVAIVDNGSTDATPHDVADAEEILRQAGLEVVVERIPFGNFGVGRNRAVEISGGTEWVMHLDADDYLMPHALEDFAALAPSADVVGFGYERSGDLKAGPRNRTRVYSSHRGEATLRSTAPCSGVSPFRRSFWERSPYRTEMRGGWDTALWIGFAHLDARFVPTRRPVFYYRQHADSIFNSRWPSERRTHFVGVKLGNLRRKISDGVAVVVPWKPDGAERDRAFEWVRRRYGLLHPDWHFVTGTVPENLPWRKGDAVADGLAKTDAATIVVADADVFVAPEALERAVEEVRFGRAPWIVPHRKVKRLDVGSTERLLDRDPKTAEPKKPRFARAPYDGYAGGGIFIVDRSDYEAAGGIPREFVGWGAEDETLAVVLDTFLGLHTRFEFDLYHLWHSPVRRMRDTQYRANRAIYRAYLARLGDPDAMWELVRHVAAGGNAIEFGGRGDRPGSVMMIAVEKFQRGKEVLEIGDLFRATEEEARRHEVRSRKIAVRATASTLALRKGRTNKEMTLDIRAEQAERNAIAQRRLATRRELLRKAGGGD